MNIRTVFLAMSLLAGFFTIPAGYTKSPIQAQHSSQSVILDIQNMTCSLGKFTIKKALQGVKALPKPVSFRMNYNCITMRPV